MQFIIEPAKRKTKKNPKIKLQCPEECYCYDPSCGGHELCMDGLNCSSYCGPSDIFCSPEGHCEQYWCSSYCACPPHIF